MAAAYRATLGAAVAFIGHPAAYLLVLLGVLLTAPAPGPAIALGITVGIVSRAYARPGGTRPAGG
jgi:hypothetical protein